MMAGSSMTPGQIEQVKLKNFMCHENLELTFDPNVNFILGQNGSGKSAVSAAIISALGGRITTTGRGLNVKNIIQKGKSKSVVSVSLNNVGDGAYMPEKYGPVVVIQRTLNTNGSSSYKLKSKNGTVISTKKVDLNAVLNFFNIQINNPVAILTQESSKTFLNSNNGKDKYAFFFKATQLELVQQKYEDAKAQLNFSSKILQNKMRALVEAQFNLEELQKKLRDCESVEMQKEKLEDLHKEYLWAVAIEMAQHANELKANIEKIENTAENQIKKIKHAELKYNETIAKENSAREKICIIQQEINKMKECQNTLIHVKKGIKEKIRELQKSIHKLTGDISEQQNQCACLALNIERIAQETQENLQKQNLENEAKLQQHCKNLRDLTAKACTLENELKRDQEGLSKLNYECSNKTEEARALRYKIEAVHGEIRNIKQCQLNGVLAYGKYMPLLLQRIKEAAEKNVFHSTPKGPIGMYVKVKDPKWMLAIEVCLGSQLLRSFVCDNNKDTETLHSMMETVLSGAMPQVITRQFGEKVYDVSEGCTDTSRFASVLDMLDISDPDIVNSLIDERSVETIILVESNALARQVMSSQPPRRCTEAITIEGHSVLPVPTYRYYSTKKTTTSLITTAKQLSHDLKLNQREIESLYIKGKEVEYQVLQLKEKVLLQKRVVEQTGKEVLHVRGLVVREKADKEDLKLSMKSDTPLVHTLNGELKKLELAAEDLENDRNQKQQLLEQYRDELKVIESKEAGYNKAQEDRNSELTVLSRSVLRKRHSDSNHFLSEKSHYEKMHQETLSKLAPLKCEYKKELACCREKVVAAEVLCPRIETRRKPVYIQAVMAEVESAIARNVSQGNVQEIKREYQTKLQEIEISNTDLCKTKSFMTKCESMMERRLQVFKKLCFSYSTRMDYLFGVNLQTRGFSGKLIFDHQNQSMEIIAKRNHSAVNTRGLSGGEKSFVTVSLLLALWDAIEVPFRILDEYDVYMDHLNRKHSMEMMLVTALKQSSQFIFLSPLDLANPDLSGKIKIIYMPEPQRNKRKKREEEEEDMDID